MKGGERGDANGLALPRRPQRQWVRDERLTRRDQHAGPRAGDRHAAAGHVLAQTLKAAQSRGLRARRFPDRAIGVEAQRQGLESEGRPVPEWPVSLHHAARAR